MSQEQTLSGGNTAMLLMKLLETEDMYGYQMIEELSNRSQNVFELKAGTMYPLLHTLEQKGFVESFEQNADNARLRKYYRLTSKGKKNLRDQEQGWKKYVHAIDNVLGGYSYAEA